MAILRDSAFCLRRYAYGESSLVAQVLTRNHGRVHLLAKGAYRPTSRFFSVIDLFHTLELEWSSSPRRDLALLRQGSLVVRRKELPFSIERYSKALTMLELADLSAQASHADPGLFDLLVRGLDGLEDAGSQPGLALLLFELGFLRNLGLAPALDRCAACGRPAEAVSSDGRRATFSAGAGGRLCLACAGEARGSGRRVGTLPVEILASAHRLMHAPPDSIRGLHVSGPFLMRLLDFIGRFLDYHLETRPRMHRAFLSVENRNRPEAGPVDRPAEFLS